MSKFPEAQFIRVQSARKIRKARPEINRTVESAPQVREPFRFRRSFLPGIVVAYGIRVATGAA